MVIDSSAIIAILEREKEAELSLSAIAADPQRLMSAVSVLECSMVQQARKGAIGVGELKKFLVRSGIEVVPLDAEQVDIAVAAFALYGKGRAPAGLNLGDFCSYALAKARKQGLLFKGNDFGATDVPRAILSDPDAVG